MYKLDLAIDRKEFDAIERRRAREEERKSRIFNDKTRQIGMDFKALDEQIREKKERLNREKERDQLYDMMAARNDKIAELIYKRQQEDIKELDKTLYEFRLMHQQAKSRREYDLYDPDGLKAEVPSRVSDDDPRCTVSGLQKFDGEDLNHKSRMEYQQNQKKQWLDYQIDAKNQSLAREKEAQRLYELKQIELDMRTTELADAEEKCRLAIDAAVKNYNKALMAERKERDNLRKQNDEDDRQMHIANALNSDLLTENPSQATSSFGANRILPDRFKGMLPDQLENIKKIQAKQIEENKRAKEEQKRLDELMDQQRMLAAKKAALMEREVERLKNLQKEEIAKENLKLSKAHKELMDHINNEVYTNQPTADYFMQFNTCSR